MTADLHVHRYGPAGPVRVLALHGLTGHGQRWQQLAEYLPEIALAAPDLIGHGRSSWSAPWTIEANVAALTAWLDEQADAPVVVVGQSFGGAIAMHLAATHPSRVAALVLLDPAIGLDGDWVRTIAEAMLAAPDYPDPGEAQAEKTATAWADVDPALLAADLAEHLVVLPNGRYGWRVSLPAMMSYWSELAREPVLPPPGTTTTLVRAVRTVPPYVSNELIAGLRQHLGPSFELQDFECGHMVDQAKPTEVAALIRQRLAAC